MAHSTFYPTTEAKSLAQAQHKELTETRTGVTHIAGFAIVVATAPKAFKAGVPLNGKAFPEGSMIVKLQWSPKKDTEAPFVVDVPDVFEQAFVMEKDSKRFPKTGGWGYAVFNYDAASNKFAPDPTSHADCGNSCHVAVKAKDYIFHPYEKR